jgi:hypothetical protein
MQNLSQAQENGCGYGIIAEKHFTGGIKQLQNS